MIKGRWLVLLGVVVLAAIGVAYAAGTRDGGDDSRDETGRVERRVARDFPPTYWEQDGGLKREVLSVRCKETGEDRWRCLMNYRWRGQRKQVEYEVEDFDGDLLIEEAR